MKKRIVALLTVSVLAVSLLVGCGGEQQTSNEGTKQEAETPEAETPEAETPEAETPEAEAPEATGGLIGISVPSADHGWMAGVIYYAQQKVDELGLAEGTGYKILTSENVNDQANDIEELISLGCSAIVLLPHNDEVSVAAQKIFDAGIKLVVFDRKVTGDYTAYVAGDNAGIGVKGAEYLGEKLGGEGKVAVMSAPSVGSVSVERTEAFVAAMEKDYPNVELIEVTADGFTQEAGLAMATDMLVANPEIDAVFSIDDEPSLGILQAIKEAGRTDIKYISGGGGAQTWYEKIQSETDIQCFTETYSPAMIGDAIEVAVQILAGEEVEMDTILDPITVDASNVADYLDAESPY